jgi:hypothetical protein
MKLNEKRKLKFLKEELLLELRNMTGSPIPSASKYYARIVNNGYVLYYNVGENEEPSPIENEASAFYSNISGKKSKFKTLNRPDYELTPAEIRKAEEFVKLGIYDKRESNNKQIKDIMLQYNKKFPGTPGESWSEKSDVPDFSVEYSLKGGYYGEFLLVDTARKIVSTDATWTENQSRRPGGSPGSADSNKTYVMPSGDVAFNENEIALKKLFKHLIKADPRVTPDYKIEAPDDRFEGETIGQVANTKRTSDIAVGSPGKIIAYHGTSTSRWPEIEKKGMIPGKFLKAYSDQIQGYSNKNLYFTMSPHKAENYATRAAIWDDSNALILKVEIPDITRIVPDEDTMGYVNLSREYTLTQSERHSHQYDYSTYTDVVTKSPGKKINFGKGQNLKDIIQILRSANLSKLGLGPWERKDISEVPDAGLDWVEDDEYKAMLKEVMSKLPELLAKGISKNGTFAYSGKISPKFIKRWKEYPKKAYPKSIETGSGSADSYEKTRKSVLKKVKKFNEAIVRNLIRTILEQE